MTTPEQAFSSQESVYSWIELARAFATGGERGELCAPVFERLLQRSAFEGGALYRVLGGGERLDQVCARGNLDVGSVSEPAARRVSSGTLLHGGVEDFGPDELEALDLGGTPFQLCRQCLVIPIHTAGDLLAVLILVSTEYRPERSAPSISKLETELGLLSLIFVHDSLTSTGPGPTAGSVDNDRVLALQTLRDMIPQVVLVKDLENRVLCANRSAGEFYHLDPRQMEGEFLWEIDPLNAGAAYREDLAVAQKRRAAVGSLEEITGVRGESRFVRTDRAPVFGDGGQVHAVVTVIEDVTEQVRSEQRLEQSQRDAARAERRRDQYLLSLAEEVREPMRQMHKRLTQLRSSLSDRAQSDVVDEVLAIGQQSLSSIQDLLDFSRVENGNLAVQTYDFRLEELVAEVLGACQRHAARRGIALASRVAPQCSPRVAADAGRVRQILIQLVGTALRVARGGEVFLTCSEIGSDGQPWLRFEVRAPSATLHPSELEEFFACYRGESGDSESKGSAHELRLALARALTELLGGRVEVEVATDRSFCCRCELPVRPPLDEAEEAPLKQPRAGARVLLCEPNENMRAIHLQRLRDLQLVVDAASEIPLALEMITAAADSGWPFDCVLLQADDSPALAKLLTAAKGRLRGPVAIMSDRELDDSWAEDADWLRLPWRQRELCDWLAEACGQEPDSPLREVTMNAEPGTVGRYDFLVVDNNPMRANVTAFALRRIGGRATVLDGVDAALESILRVDYDLVLVDEDYLREGHEDFIDQVRTTDGAQRRTRVAVGVHEARASSCEELAALGYDGCIGKPLDTEALFRVLSSSGSLLS